MSASQEILRLDLLNREAFLLQKIGVSWESHGSLMGVLWESHGSLTLPICHHFHAQEEAAIQRTFQDVQYVEDPSTNKIGSPVGNRLRQTVSYSGPILLEVEM